MDSTSDSLASHQEWYRDRVRELEGKIVLVTPGNSPKNPSVGMRGTLHVSPQLEVEIVLQYAVMFDRPAEKKTIRLNEQQVARLLAAEYNGVYSFVVPGEIDDPPGEGFVVASPKL